MGALLSRLLQHGLLKYHKLHLVLEDQLSSFQNNNFVSTIIIYICYYHSQHMRDQEVVHLENLSRIMPQRRVRPTLLLPIWHAAGYILGIFYI